MPVWSERFEALAFELRRLERQASTDDIEVKTYPDKTVVTLTYPDDELVQPDDLQFEVTD